ncbi:MAG: hypothetical protein DHS80DRAFT_30936 [Piptocephalis tieghemiana]|nr:MAG: hypothetical protein DHS80DRAFT_30936 [Piptocephalis tieghemiana]
MKDILTNARRFNFRKKKSSSSSSPTISSPLPQNVPPPMVTVSRSSDHAPSAGAPASTDRFSMASHRSETPSTHPSPLLPPLPSLPSLPTSSSFSRYEEGGLLPPSSHRTPPSSSLPQPPHLTQTTDLVDDIQDSGRSILIGIDLLPESTYTFRWTQREQLRDGDRVHLVHVLDTNRRPSLASHSSSSSHSASSSSSSQKAHILALERECVSHLTTFVKKNWQSGISAHVVIHVLRGKPVDVLISLIDDLVPDLVVLGSRGHSSLKAIIRGSVSTQLIRRSLVPVLIVRDPSSIKRPSTASSTTTPASTTTTTAPVVASTSTPSTPSTLSSSSSSSHSSSSFSPSTPRQHSFSRDRHPPPSLPPDHQDLPKPNFRRILSGSPTI